MHEKSKICITQLVEQNIFFEHLIMKPYTYYSSFFTEIICYIRNRYFLILIIL